MKQAHQSSETKIGPKLDSMTACTPIAGVNEGECITDPRQLLPQPVENRPCHHPSCAASQQPYPAARISHQIFIRFFFIAVSTRQLACLEGCEGQHEGAACHASTIEMREERVNNWSMLLMRHDYSAIHRIGNAALPCCAVRMVNRDCRRTSSCRCI